MAKDTANKVIREAEDELNKYKKEITKVKTKLTDKTIKVSTLIKIGAIIATIALSFISGWVSNTQLTNYDQNRVKTEAKALVTELKSGK